MNLAQKAHNVIRGLLQAYGTTSLKRRLWDAEFREGRWSCLDASPHDCVYACIEKWAQGGSILDLGCGTGNTASELPADAYRDYTGVDVSGVAIDKARKRTAENGRASKSNFFKADVSSYVPSQQYDVILFRESLYYFPPGKIRSLLSRYAKFVKPGGAFIVRLFDLGGKRRDILEMIESKFDVAEKHIHAESGVSIIIFRPPASRPVTTSGHQL
jgi:SAM-dependent methyltransferase